MKNRAAWRWVFPAWSLGLLLAGPALCRTAPEPTGPVPDALQQPEVADLEPLFCWATPVPDEYANNKSGYTACVAGPDGKVYLGTANYYDYGDWLAYNPRDRSIKRVVDLSRTIAENLYDINTQGKTHTQLAIGPDGRIYGGTKQGHELFATRPEIGEQAGGYPGGHLIAYDPRTGLAQDLGILRAQDGLMNGIVDHERRRIYFKTEPRMHFLIYEIDTHQVIDKGRVGTWSRYIDMDDRGDVWIPNRGRMTRYDVGDLRQIQEFDLAGADSGVVPMRYVCNSVPEPFAESSDIHTMIQDAKGRIYWTADVGQNPKQTLIMRYDPHRGQGECLGYVVDAEFAAHRDLHNGLGSIQGSAIGPDGTLYIMATYPYYILEFPRLTAD